MAERILVVDDDTSVLLLLKTVLEREGWQVDAAASPAEAMAFAGERAYQLIIVDKNLPGKTGFDVVAEVRLRQPELPAIMITAFPEPLLAQAVRIQGYLPKPLDSIRQISDTVSKVLEFARQVEELRLRQKGSAPRLDEEEKTPVLIKLKN